MSNHHLEESSFLFGPNGPFIAELHARFLGDPNSVDPSWQGFFRELNDDARAVIEELRGASWAPKGASPLDGNGGLAESGEGNGTAAVADGCRRRARYYRGGYPWPRPSIRSAPLMLIRAYRVRGHLQADLDPLGLKTRRAARRTRSQELRLHGGRFRPPNLHQQRYWAWRPATLNEILKAVHETYCGKIGVEFMHIQDLVAEGVDPGAHRVDPQHHRVQRDRPTRDPGSPDRGRGLRALPRQEIHRH